MQYSILTCLCRGSITVLHWIYNSIYNDLQIGCTFRLGDSIACNNRRLIDADSGFHLHTWSRLDVLTITDLPLGVLVSISDVVGYYHIFWFVGFNYWSNKCSNKHPYFSMSKLVVKIINVYCMLYHLATCCQEW